MLRLDVYRISYRKRLVFLLPLLVLCCFIAYQDVFFGDLPLPLEVRRWFTLNSAWNTWEPFAGGFSFLVLNYLAFVMTALPASDLFYEDHHSRLQYNLMLHHSSRQIATSHFLISFLAGFLIVLFASVAQNLMIFTKIPMFAVSAHYVPSSTLQNILPSFFLHHPFLYMLMTFFRCSCFGGILSCMALSVNYWLKGSYAGIFLPFFLINGFGILWNRLAMALHFSQQWFAQFMISFPYSMRKLNTMTRIELSVWFLFCLVTLMHASKNRDVL